MGAALLARKEALAAVGGLDEDFFLFSEEVDLAYRLGEAGWQTWFTPEAEVAHVGGAVERLAAFADAHPRAGVVGPRLSNVDGTLQRSARGFPTVWRLATEYLFLRKPAPRSGALNAVHRRIDWVPCFPPREAWHRKTWHPTKRSTSG